jgi:transglutaminase-like putative cysteine protease
MNLIAAAVATRIGFMSPEQPEVALEESCTMGKRAWGSVPVLMLALAAFGMTATAAEPAPAMPLELLSTTETVPTAEQERIVASLPRIPPGLNQKYALEVQLSKRITASYTFPISTPSFVAKQWMIIAACPPDLPCQKVSSLGTTPASETVEDLSPLRRKLFRATVRVKEGQFPKWLTFKMDFDADLFARKLVPRNPGNAAPKAAALSDEERKLALLPTRTEDYTNPVFAEWVARHELQRMDQEGEVDFARRVFQYIAKNFKYDYQGKMDKIASQICTGQKGECARLSILFVAVMRSQGVPARVLSGRLARASLSNIVKGIQTHSWPEFFALGVGWVPVDPAYAVASDKSPEKLKYFGNDAGDRVVFHVDLDLTFIPSGDRGQTITRRFLVIPVYAASGSGNLADAVVNDVWKVSLVAPDKRGK